MRAKWANDNTKTGFDLAATPCIAAVDIEISTNCFHPAAFAIEIFHFPTSNNRSKFSFKLMWPWESTAPQPRCCTTYRHWLTDEHTPSPLGERFWEMGRASTPSTTAQRRWNQLLQRLQLRKLVWLVRMPLLPVPSSWKGLESLPNLLDLVGRDSEAWQ